MKFLFCFGALFLALACKASPETAATARDSGKDSAAVRDARAREGARGTSAAKGDDDLVPGAPVAKIGDTTINFGALLDRAKTQINSIRTDYLTKRYELLKDALSEIVEQQLLEVEAKSRGIDVKAMMATEVEAKVAAPSEEEIKKVFDMAKDRVDKPYEQIKPEIVKYLKGSSSAKARETFVKSLRDKHKVETMLPMPDLPRVEVSEAGGPAMGPENAPVKIIEFSDFECPYCSRGANTVKEVVKKYGDKVRLVFRDYPLPFHSNAKKAHESALCAHEQGKFWEMHDKLFANQQALSVDALKGYAKELALDTAKFNECLDSGSKAEIVKRNLEDGSKVGVNGTPAFFINGRLISGAQPFEAFAEAIDAELARKSKSN